MDLNLRFLKTARCLPGYYPLLSIDREMENAGIRPLLNNQTDAEIYAAKALSRARLVRNFYHLSTPPVFVGLMGFSESRTLPFSYWTEIIPYCFDCWPPHYSRWESFFRRHRVRLAFFSARQSAVHFINEIPEMASVWLPEATDPTEYSPARPLIERDVDVLELGRKHELYHVRITGALEYAQKSHKYVQYMGMSVFPGKTGFVEGLGRSRISICFPCSETNPERAVTVETVTHRYFESIASKCLILGHAPKELIDLFGYNPVIEVAWGSEFEQIRSLLNNIATYQEFVERNYERLLEVGTWESRIAMILSEVRRHS
jgi:hypothetical protein